MVKAPGIVLALVLIGGCNSGGGSTSVATDGSDRRDSTRYEANTTVLESPKHGPQLCFGGVMESLPPQCSGPDIVGWDWSKVDGEESANGTTWGDYRVVGTWDGERLTLTEPPSPVKAAQGPDGIELATPCPEPEGGWRVVDERKATQEAQSAALSYASAQPEAGGAWIDQGRNERVSEGISDPAKTVVNARFTSNLERHEREMRKLWGGALCVIKAERPQAELERVQDEIVKDAEEIRLLSASVSVARGVVRIYVVIADPALQARFDERYGEGVVELRGALQPVE